MIECDSCKSWLHDSCESLSNEEYFLLGELPDSIPYTCSICQKVPGNTNTASWIQAIEESRNNRVGSVSSHSGMQISSFFNKLIYLGCRETEFEPNAEDYLD